MSIELLTKAEAAEVLRVSEDTLEALIKSGQLPAYKIAKTCTRIDREDLMAYLAARQIKVAALQKSRVTAKELRRQKRIRELPCGYTPGMKVVDWR